jgi:hypothetical protein
MKYILILFVGLAITSPTHASGGGWETLNTSYSVPVPEELAAYANFPNQKVKHRVRDGRAEFVYELPVELTGDPVEVHARDVDGGGVHFVGELSEMTCSETECLVKYPGLALDAQKVQATLESKGVQGEELKARMQVFARFDGGNPAGVIHFQD